MRRITTTKIVKIGNSRGIRIPKALLEQANLTGEVQLVLEGDHIELRPTGKPRAGDRRGGFFQDPLKFLDGLLEGHVAVAGIKLVGPGFQQKFLGQVAGEQAHPHA